MSEYGDAVDAILKKGASAWTKDESQTIANLVANGHRGKLRVLMNELRGADKPKINNNQMAVS